MCFKCVISYLICLLLYIQFADAAQFCSEVFRKENPYNFEVENSDYFQIPSFIRFPQGSNILLIKPKDMNLFSNIIKNSYRSLTHHLDPLKKEIESKFSINTWTDTNVLYLATGIDGGLSHALFPEAHLHITVDDSPTYDPNSININKPFEAYLGSNEAKWPYVIGGVRDKYSGPDLLYNIISNLPKEARVRGLIFILPPNEKVVKYGMHPEPAVHFLLLYDLGENTPMNMHWHIQGELPRTIEMTQNIWWFKSLMSLPLKVIMTKANSGAISQPIAQSFRENAKANNGILLDDNGNDLVDIRTDEYHGFGIEGGFGYNKSGAYFSRPK